MPAQGQACENNCIKIYGRRAALRHIQERTD